MSTCNDLRLCAVYVQVVYACGFCIGFLNLELVFSAFKKVLITPIANPGKYSI